VEIADGVASAAVVAHAPDLPVPEVAKALHRGAPLAAEALALAAERGISATTASTPPFPKPSRSHS
jgi:hypothetical protein